MATISPHSCLSAFLAVVMLLAAGTPPAVSAPKASTSIRVTEQIDPAIFKDLRVPTYMWSKSNSKPNAIIFGLHGGVLHGRAFTSLARSLAEQNNMFVSMDMRGFGRWVQGYGTERDKTFNFDNTVADIRSMLIRLRSQYPGVPIYFLGESLGANMSMMVASETPQLIDGLILASPFTALKPFLSPRMLVNLVSILLNPAHKIDIAPYLDDRLANSEVVAERRLEEPLARHQQSIRELLKGLNASLKGKKLAKRMNPNLPVLMLVPEEDKLISRKATDKLFKDLPNIDKQFVVLPNTGHLILETPAANATASRLVGQWIREKKQELVASRQRAQTLSRARSKNNRAISRQRVTPRTVIRYY